MHIRAKYQSSPQLNDAVCQYGIFQPIQGKVMKAVKKTAARRNAKMYFKNWMEDDGVFKSKKRITF